MQPIIFAHKICQTAWKIENPTYLNSEHYCWHSPKEKVLPEDLTSRSLNLIQNYRYNGPLIRGFENEESFHGSPTDCLDNPDGIGPKRRKQPLQRTSEKGPLWPHNWPRGGETLRRPWQMFCPIQVRPLIQFFCFLFCKKRAHQWPLFEQDSIFLFFYSNSLSRLITGC